MHSSVSAQHASPCKSMRDDVSSVSQLFDMQRAFLCKFVSTALDTEQESVHLVPVGMGVHVWMKRMDFTASVLRALSPLTVTPRWTSVAAAHVSMAHAGMTSTGMNYCSLCHSLK